MQAWTKRLLTWKRPTGRLLAVRPTNTTTPVSYKRAFVQRVKAARIDFGKSPAEMSKLMGVPKDTYHRYETRTLLPHYLIEYFCRLTDKEVEWLITGARRQDALPARHNDGAGNIGDPRISRGRMTG